MINPFSDTSMVRKSVAGTTPALLDAKARSVETVLTKPPSSSSPATKMTIVDTELSEVPDMTQDAIRALEKPGFASDFGPRQR